jgi:threonine aldolase
MKTYDLRSDTVTLPSPGMRKAMYEAEVGDDVYGEDPTVNRLQDLSAAMLGKEAALFVSSGSMGNLIPLYINCGRGGEFIADSRSHVLHYEMAASTTIAGCMPVAIPTDDGILSAELLEGRTRPAAIYYYARSRLVHVENTHNLAGGTCYPLATLKGVKAFADRHGLALHMDGARLFNAAAATRVAARELAAQTTTVTFCLSKGLGCPVGAMVLGTKDFIAEARRVRKMLGGGMRQVGILAAAGIYALEHNVERIAEDHENARLLATALAETSWAKLDPAAVVSNIVYFKTPGRDPEAVVKALEAKGVRSGTGGPDSVRLVTHLDCSRQDAQEVASIIRAVKL